MLVSRLKIGLGVATTAAVGLLIAACSTSTQSAPPTAVPAPSGAPAARTDVNAADAAFVETMYPHHAQAVEMAALSSTRSQNQQILGLATRIDRSQYKEMGQIIGLLRNFGIPVPTAAASMGEPPGMPAMGDMPGMMSAEQMSSLERLSGNDFDRMWLTMMIEHHDGAITMAKIELANGVNPNARGLAQQIIASQEAEITLMQSMLG